MGKKIITGIGEILWDEFPDGAKMGGAPANFCYHASLTGNDAYVVSAVGNDKSGIGIRDQVRNLGLSDQYIQTVARSTGRVSVKLGANGIPAYMIHQEVAWDYIRWEAQLNDLARNTDAVCFGSLAQRNQHSGECIDRFLNAVSNDCLVVFDVNIRQHFYSEEVVERSLKHANVFKLSDEELPIIAGMFDLAGETKEQLKEILQLFDLKLIAYTMGADGSLLMTDSEDSVMVAPKTVVEDTVGAGDSFTAILIAGLLENIPLRGIQKRASEVAAFVCAQKGATPIINKEIVQFN